MDAALADPADNTEKEDSLKDANDGGNDLDENLDLENFGKKKKKKKKPFNLDELENNLPSADNDEKKDEALLEGGGGGEEGGNIEDDYDLDVDFSKTKKKKKKKKELDELVSEKTEEGGQTQNENGEFIFLLIKNVYVDLFIQFLVIFLC